jgi:hypothetical protein
MFQLDLSYKRLSMHDSAESLAALSFLDLASGQPKDDPGIEFWYVPISCIHACM